VSSFVFAGLSSAVISLISLSIARPVNTPAIIGFFILGLIAWLSSRSLEQALQELRVTNANLDSLVAERTRALAQSLARERFEAGQRQAILNSIADGVIVYDTNRKSILANPAIQGLLETPVEQIVDRTFSDLVKSPRLSGRDRGLLQAMMETNTHPSSFRVDWGRKTLSVSAAQVYDTENVEIGTVAVFREVTREAELERMKSSFIAIVSHELRTPLNAIMGFAEMIKESVYGPVNDKQVVASERIVMNTRHMLGMVGDLLDQAQIEAGKLRISTERFRPVELLRNVQGVMAQIVADKGLTLTTEVDPRLPELFTGDPNRLQQILINLVNNAVKFTDQGGIHIRLFVADLKHWGMEIKDTGRGIPEPELDHIFDAFHQVDSTTTRQQGGFGLGLSIVRQLVQLMEGKIYVDSALGRGTTLTITLPLAEEDLEVKRAMSQSALIIEDDADLAAIFAEALKSAGFEPQVIRDGAIAQRRIKEITPHIIILDLHLPHVDGSTLLTQIRADGALKGTIVIVATADALMGELYRDVADIVLIKPISFIQLRDLSARLRAVQLNPNPE
jgi:PAS domain S-box-containing protein